MIEGHTELQPSDFFAASRTRLALLGRLSLAIIAVFLLPALLSSKPVPWIAWLPPPLFLALTLAVIMALGRGKWATSAFRDAVGDGSRQATFRLSDRGLELESNGRRTELAWSAVQRVVETPQAFVAVGRTTTLIMPFRAFASDDLPKVRKLVAERVPPASLLRRAGCLVLATGAMIVVALSIWQYLEDANHQPPPSPELPG